MLTFERILAIANWVLLAVFAILFVTITVKVRSDGDLEVPHLRRVLLALIAAMGSLPLFRIFEPTSAALKIVIFIAQASVLGWCYWQIRRWERGAPAA